MFVDNPINTTGVQQFAAYRGRPVDVVVTYTTRSSWPSIDSSWVVDNYAGYAGRLVIGLPLTISGTDLTTVASGADDSYFAAFAKMLVSKGRANSIVRLGWEFNGNWYAWSAYDAAGYVAAFRHVVTVLRENDPQLLIDWTGNLGSSQCGNDPFTQLYPGDAYVDIVGVDAYDTKWAKITSLTSFASWTKQSYGLNAWFAFAAQHGKPFSVPEWGVLENTTTDGSGEGDNAVYVQGMHAWFADHAAGVAYEAYFNDPNTTTVANSLENPVQMPLAAQTYAQLWAGT